MIVSAGIAQGWAVVEKFESYQQFLILHILTS